jgi:hypothetical protein
MSTLAMAIKKVLGEDEDIIYFDKLHVKLKSLSRKLSKAEQTDYKQTLAILQQKILLKKIEVTDSIKEYEKEFLQLTL